MSLKRPHYQEDSAENAINISPLIDVLFILLIFFIVTMVFSNRETLGIDTPKASNTSQAQDNAVYISIDKAGLYYYNSQVINLELLRQKCAELNAQAPICLMLEADAKASVQSVVSLIDMSKEIGIAEVYVIAEK